MILVMRTKHCCACRARKDLHYHHLVPKSVGGSDDDTNVITLCRHCHGKIHGKRKSFGASELIKEGIKKRRGKGLAFGVLPYGMKRGKGDRIVQDREQQKVIRKILKLRGEGVGYKTIHRQLGGIVSLTTLKRICYREDDNYDPLTRRRKRS